MTKKILLLCTLVLAFHISGCTSNQSQDENQVIENADVDKIDSENSLDASALDATTPPSTSDDASLQAALGEGIVTKPADTVTMEPSAAPMANDAIAADVAAAPTLDESSLTASNEMPSAGLDASTPNPEIATNITDANSATSLPPAMDMSAPVTSSDSMNTMNMADASTLTETPIVENSGSNSVMLEQPVAMAKTTSVAKSSGPKSKKIAEMVPYKIESGWVNGVYIVRPGEKLKDISQRIYSADKTKELKKIAENSYLKSRAPAAGDKIFYVSPNRPEDSSKTLFYYEDMGMVPETYVAKKGDNFKKIAKNILGYDKAYLEMWAANPVESKTKLNEGDTIRYWKSASGVTTAQNMNKPGAAQLIDPSQMPNQAMMPPAQDASLPPPPPHNEMAQQPNMQGQVAANNMANELPPPPPADMAGSLPPPPPPPPEMAPPPPPSEDMAAAPAPAAMKKRKTVSEEEPTNTMGGLDEDTMMSLGAVVVLLAALVIVLIRRKKKKASEQSAMMNETHVGT